MVEAPNKFEIELIFKVNPVILKKDEKISKKLATKMMKAPNAKYLINYLIT